MSQARYRDSELVEKFIENPVSFFKGEGRFFYRDRDRDSHLYGASMSLLLGEYVNNNFISMGEFINGFSVFVSSLSGTREDLYHFLCNMLAFNRCMYDDEEIDRDLFMLGEPLHTISKEYLSQIDEDFSQEGFFYDVSNGSEPCYAITRFYPQSGSCFLLESRLKELVGG